MSRSFQSLAHLRPLPLDFDVCYRALCSRDARFDGQFFTAVTSTGIYCRPICLEPLPKQRMSVSTSVLPLLRQMDFGPAAAVGQRLVLARPIGTSVQT